MTPSKQLLIGRVLRDPLFHFLLAGAAIYIAYGLSVDRTGDVIVDENTVVVSAGDIEWFESAWEKRWGRPPTPEEREGLIDQFVRETILYREAIALGLDQDDVVIRRRLAQKFKFLTQDLLQPPPPSEEVLKAYFEENVERYRAPELITISHVFFDPDKRGAATLDDAEAAKVKLNGLGEVPVDSKSFGDPFLLQSYYPQRSIQELAKLFGSGFTDPVFKLEAGKWYGPILSGYGTHLVFVHDKIIPPDPGFDQVSEAVLRDWTEEKREEMNDQFMAGILDRYTVVIEEPAAEPGPLAEGESQ